MKLETVRELRQEIKKLNIRIETLRAVSSVVSIPVLDGMPRTRGQESVVERYAQKLVDAQDELAKLRRQLVIEQERLTEEIFQRVENPTAAAILIRRYVNGETFKVTGIDLGYSEASVYYFHRVGRREFLKASGKADDNHVAAAV